MEQYIPVHTGTNCDVLRCTDQPGYACLMDSLLQFCQAGSAVFETNASSSTFQSSQKCRSPAATLGGWRFGSRLLGAPAYWGAPLRLPISDPANAYVHVSEAHTAYICTNICTRYKAIHIAYARVYMWYIQQYICMYMHVSVCICFHLWAVSSAYDPVCRLHTGTYIHIWIEISVCMWSTYSLHMH